MRDILVERASIVWFCHRISRYRQESCVTQKWTPKPPKTSWNWTMASQMWVNHLLISPSSVVRSLSRFGIKIELIALFVISFLFLSSLLYISPIKLLIYMQFKYLRYLPLTWLIMLPEEIINTSKIHQKYQIWYNYLNNYFKNLLFRYQSSI